MKRELKFNLDVETNALLCPNPGSFYSKAYITEDTVDNFRIIPNVKNATKVANVVFDNVLKPFSCGFSSTDNPLDAIDIDVCSLSALSQVCQADLEQSFLALQMTQGSNSNFEVASFFSYYWDELAKEIASELAQLRWKGDTNLPASPATFLQYCDGYEVKFSNDNQIVDLSAPVGGVTAGNVLAEMVRVHQALPAAVKFKTADLRFYVSANVASAFQYAAAAGNTMTYITASLPLTFLGIKVVVCEGMSDNTMVLTLKDNLIYAVDSEGDPSTLKAVNLSDTIAEPVIRTRVNLKAGFHYVNPTEIVYYS